MRPLESKVAVVTGAGRGIGRAIAMKLASAGTKLIVNDLDIGPAQDVVQEIRNCGGDATAYPGDITRPDFGERFIAAAVDTYKGLDIIVNNAGYTWDSVIQKMSDEQWYAIIDCHLTAPFRILRAAQPVIREFSKAEQAGGQAIFRKVVNISSASGLSGNPGQVNYSAAKAGIIGLTMTLAKEWGRLNTNVNCVAFGLIETRLTATTSDVSSTIQIGPHEVRVGVNPQFLETLQKNIPLGHAGSPEDAANAVYLLCLPESNYISGQTILCSGGLSA
ncbi:MAG: SDR family oxidoreductase [Burkholderiaceae bacterium]|nr:MAG: SDR family oxidoreductase [Burkholderiaceae bacterium]